MKKKPLEYQIYLTQILCITLSILLTLAVSIYYVLKTKISSLDDNISNVGFVLSRSFEVTSMIQDQKSSPEFIEYLDSLIEDLQYVDVISICDINSIRYYHTTKEQIGGLFVGGDETSILQGSAPYITVGVGTMGPQRRSFHPIVNQNNEIIGFIMVSVLTTSISRLTHAILFTFLILSLLLVAVAFLLSRLLYQRLKKVLLGYKPEELGKIHLEQEEVLDSLEEGIFAINTQGTIILMNNSARKILELETLPPPGTKLIDIYPDTRLPQVLSSGTPEYNIDLIIHGKHILSSRIPIRDNGITIGAVSIFRNKTEVKKLADELTGARYMVDTLRAFNHEFKNKLHVILGYVEMGESEKITRLILNTVLISTKAVNEITQKIQVPDIAALLIGKIIRTNELGIQLILKSNSICFERHLFLPADIYITLIGNLVENAIEELNQAQIPIKVVEVEIVSWENGILISVDDTGRGIPAAIREKIFEHGFSTKGENRGTGMAFIKDIVERYHGNIQLDTELNEGTSFTITFTKDGIRYV